MRPLRKLFKIAGIILISAVGLLFLGGTLFAVRVWSRKPLQAFQSTVHPELSRKECIDCHAPVADEWRQSFHFKSLNGPYWKLVRDLGYQKTFDRVRKPCVHCHAPANVLDLTQKVQGKSLGVECTPNLLENPDGVIPEMRFDDPELGVDCVACHVSSHGILGTGKYTNPVHETIADARFLKATAASESLCRICHTASVNAWEKSSFASAGSTCLDCHMPLIQAPLITGGPARFRRSHRFLADKDPGMIDHAIHATLNVTGDRKAILTIINDRVGHFLPSGGNAIIADFNFFGPDNQPLQHQRKAFYRDETLLLDFWPFNIDGRIPSGAKKQVSVPLPDGHGKIEVVILYHDFMKANRKVRTLTRSF